MSEVLIKQVAEWVPEQSASTLCSAPNMFAASPSAALKNGHVVVRGYQEFVLSPTLAEAVSYALIQKTRVLAPYLKAEQVQGHTVLDIGAGSGYFSFRALQAGASEAIAIDIDDEAMAPMRFAKMHFGIRNLRTVTANMSEWHEPADIVLALALIHWVYSCTAPYGCIDAAIGKLASLTKYMCIIEWVEPEDPLIVDFKHTSWNKDLQREPYTRQAFEKAMNKYFAKWEYIGCTNPTRKLYAAFVTHKKREMGGPLPLLLEKEKIVSSAKLCTVDGVEYWSRVYDRGDSILKQATLDLAARESVFLKAIGPGAVPRVLDVRQHDTYSTFTMEKVDGVLASSGHCLIDTPAAFFKFANGLLEVLARLKELRIQHRDLHADNILIRDGLPVLIDFGWAAFAGTSNILPKRLMETLPEQTEPCDVYSAGMILQKLNAGRFPEFNFVHELMTERDPHLRVTDPLLLRKFCTLAREIADGRKCFDPAASDFADETLVLATILQKYQHLVKTLRCRVQSLGDEKDRLAQTLQEQESSPRALLAQTLQENVHKLQSDLNAVRQSMSFRLALKLSSLRRRLAPGGSRRARLLDIIFKALRKQRPQDS